MKHLFSWKAGLSWDSWPPILGPLAWFARISLKQTGMTDKPTWGKEQANYIMEQTPYLGSRFATDTRKSLRKMSALEGAMTSLVVAFFLFHLEPSWWTGSSQCARTLCPGSPLEPATLPPTETGSPWTGGEGVSDICWCHARRTSLDAPPSTIPIAHSFSFESLLSFLSPPSVSTRQASLALWQNTEARETAGMSAHLEVKTCKICSANLFFFLPHYTWSPFFPGRPAACVNYRVKTRHHSLPGHEMMSCLLFLITHTSARFSSCTLTALVGGKKGARVLLSSARKCITSAYERV